MTNRPDCLAKEKDMKMHLQSWGVLKVFGGTFLVGVPDLDTGDPY
jgi:hypothetical protein